MGRIVPPIRRTGSPNSFLCVFFHCFVPHSDVLSKSHASEASSSLGLPASGVDHMKVSLRQTGTPASIPDHELLCRIGEGSYGEVWLARSAISVRNLVELSSLASLVGRAARRPTVHRPAG